MCMLKGQFSDWGYTNVVDDEFGIVIGAIAFIIRKVIVCWVHVK